MEYQKALPIFRTLWVAVSFISLIWFSYWILYEAIVWNKLFTQATPMNYIALILSLALVIIGTQLRKLRFFKKPEVFIEQNLPKTYSKKNQIPQIEQIHEEDQIQHNQSADNGKKQLTTESKVPKGCNFYLGYLPKRLKSEEIPDGCLVCDKMVNCLSE